MASAGNPSNQQPFDMNKLFKPSSGPPPTSSSTPIASNMSPFTPTVAPPGPPIPSSSSIGATSPSSGPFPPSFNLYSPLLTEQQQMMANAHHHYQHRPISYPSPPPSIPPNLPPSSNTANSGGARLMALLGSNNSSPNVNLANPPQHVQLSAPFSSSGGSGATASTPPEFSMPVNPPSVNPSAPPANFMATSQPTPVHFPSRKLPKGRHLIGQQITYDIDARLPGEMQPQLEVTPITKYVSDPGLVIGRQIAVNRTYICYGLRQGNIRVLNINTASRSLLRGHTQRVSDMAFFADDVHLLASASVDGWVFIWKINEGPDEEEKPQIAGKIVVALQIIGEGEAVHPRICWHCHKQEILVVAIGNHILKIDSIKLGKGEEFSAEEPLKCPIDKLINGVQFVGKHGSEITELSMCQWMTTRLASASLDGTVKIWEDRKTVPLAILRPHDDQPVNSVTFLTSPQSPDHIILITGGPLNREVKVWTSASEEGWLLPSDSESWRCTQTLEFRSSNEPRIEDAFFNQVVALPQACLLLLANAKKNAIYAVHIGYGPNPSATRMDYIAEFTVTMPILSLTGTSESLPGGEHLVQVYCVQTQAIQQYALDLTLCLPTPLESVVLDATDSSVSPAFDGASSDRSASMEVSHSNKPAEIPLSSAVPVPPTATTAGDSDPVTTHPVRSSSVDTAVRISSNGAEKFQTMAPIALGSRVVGQLSDFRSPPNSSEPSPHNSVASAEKPVVDRRVEAIKENWVDPLLSHDISQKDEENVTHHDVSVVNCSPVTFKHPTHLITPSEILSKAVPSSENSQSAAGMTVGDSKIQDVAVNKDVENIEVEVKVVDEGQGEQENEYRPTKEPHIIAMEEKEKSFFSQASDIGIQMARDFHGETYDVDVPPQTCKNGVNEELLRPNASEEEIRGLKGNMPAKSGETATPTVQQSPASATKGKRHKGKTSQASAPSLPCPSPFNSTDSSNGPVSSSGTTSIDTALSQVMTMQDMLDQVLNMQKEMQKQMSMMVSAPVTKEGRRLESSFGRSMEKVVKANMDALWARFQEENAKHEKLERDYIQQLTDLFTNSVNKDLPALLEKTWKKEIPSLGPNVARAIVPVLEKAISTAIADSVQKGIGDKAIGQLERLVNSKLETTVARQIQVQFQTSGKQALQDALKSSFEATVIPSFEASCRTMFDQVDATFHKGLIKHAAVSQEQFESTLSPLAVSLRDAINSASSITQTLSGELADGQRKLLAMASATANTNPLVTQLSSGSLAGLNEITEASTDPTKELSRLISEHKYDEAFTTALHRSDVSVVSWLCSQVDLKRILSSVPIPLSQGVLLALLQQLSCDIHRETMKKLAWITDIAVAINPTDPMIIMHVRPIFEQVYQILGHQRNLPGASPAEASSIHVAMHVINSMLMSCK